MWIVEESQAELEFMRRIVKKAKRKVIKKKIIKRKEIMSDADFQAAVTAAVVAAIQGVIASSGYAATGVSGSYTYTPPVTATPPAETVSFSL